MLNKKGLIRKELHQIIHKFKFKYKFKFKFKFEVLKFKGSSRQNGSFQTGIYLSSHIY